MTCRSDECKQGRDRCPTPGYCADIGYEAAGTGYLPRDQADPLPIMYADEREPEDPAPPFGPAWAVYLAVVVACALLGYVLTTSL